MALTDRQQRFIAEYLTDLNAKRAAIAVGYSPKTAESQASQLLKNPKVAAEVSKRTGKLLTKLDISAERTLNEIGRAAFFDPRRFFNADGSLKQITELDDDTAAALAGFEIEELYEHFGKGQAKAVGQVKKFKLVSKLDGLKMLAQYHKLLTDRVEVTGLEGLADRISKARKSVNL